MSNNSIGYWRNWYTSEITLPITKDGFIFKYSIINQNSNDGNSDWICCNSKKKLYGFIKYFILPSIQLSRSIGIRENTVCFFVLDYDDTIAYLDNPELDNWHEHIETYKRWFNEIDKLERLDAQFNEIRDFINKITLEVDYRKYIFVELDLFENISSVGKTLIEEYEADDVLDILESDMDLSKDQIIDLFENINSNKFMLKNIVNLLTDRIM
ncbi:hypothetical protein [Clostridium sp.]|uniref:hypothetical protein n=1 Tax=Clostridium sp. TaxID=1506 RepID=UPI001DA95702|nr:hypothetical protein [Clostridium sp.]MBS5937601.1 hypothetical protein [Clostridium sp.]